MLKLVELVAFWPLAAGTRTRNFHVPSQNSPELQYESKNRFALPFVEVVTESSSFHFLSQYCRITLRLGVSGLTLTDTNPILLQRLHTRPLRRSNQSNHR